MNTPRRVCCGKVSLKVAVTAIAVFEFVVIGAAVIGPWIAGQILQAVLTGVGSLLAPMILMYGARNEVSFGPDEKVPGQFSILPFQFDS